MASGKKWIKEIETLSLSEKQKLRDALSELSQWKFFNQEFVWTGYCVIKGMLQESIDEEIKKIEVSV